MSYIPVHTTTRDRRVRRLRYETVPNAPPDFIIGGVGEVRYRRSPGELPKCPAGRGVLPCGPASDSGCHHVSFSQGCMWLPSDDILTGSTAGPCTNGGRVRERVVSAIGLCAVTDGGCLCGPLSLWPRMAVSCVSCDRKRDVAQLGSASALGAEGRRFKSCHPDKYVHGTHLQQVREWSAAPDSSTDSTQVVSKTRRRSEVS